MRALSSAETAAGRAATSHCTKRLESIDSRSLEVRTVTDCPVVSLMPVVPTSMREIKTAPPGNGLTLKTDCRLPKIRQMGTSGH